MGNNKGTPADVKTGRERLSATATMNNLLATLAEGHPGSADVLRLICQFALSPLDTLFDLDDMNIRGRQIWHAFHQVCDGDFNEFLFRLDGRDPDLVSAVNLLTLGERERAVESGGSDYHLHDSPTLGG